MRIVFSFGTAVFATSLLASACVQDDDDIWMPPTGTGKADGITKISGSTIPSQFVDQTKDYLTSRRIDSLQQVGALTGDDLAIAMRADGIIANLPANGRIEAAELARMEVPSIFATLFPNEQAALPHVWPLLMAPGGASINVGAIGNDMTVTQALTPPGGLVPPTSIVITTLDQGLQMVARRVQLVFNGDATATTIQVADIESVIAMPQAFTPAEVEQLKVILTEFRTRAVSTSEARAIVPDPGSKTVHVTAGTMELDYSTEVVLEESRSSRVGLWSGSMRSLLTTSATLTAGPTDAMILLELGTESEHVLMGASTPLPAHGAGELVLERYVAGAQKESHSLAVPAFSTGTTAADMTRFLDWKLVLANGTPLVKNAVATTANGTWSATFHHDKTQITTPGLDSSSLASVETPDLGLPPGHYEVPTPYGPATFDFYPQRVVMGSYPGNPNMQRMTFTDWGNPTAKTFVAMAGGRFQYTPATKTMVAWIANQTPFVVLNAAMRTR